MLTLSIVSIVAVLTIGIAALIADPERPSNRLFFFTSLLYSATLSLISLSIVAIPSGFSRETLLNLLRANAAAASLIPWNLALLCHFIQDVKSDFNKASRSTLWALGISAIAFSISLTEWNIPSDSEPSNPKRGLGYILINIITLFSYTISLIRAISVSSRRSGRPQKEATFLATTTILGGMISVVAIFIGNLTGINELKQTGLSV